MISKEKFVEYMEFIEEKKKQELTLCNLLETMCPGNYCDAFIFSEYETKLINLLADLLNDETNLIEYKLYEFSAFNTEDKEEQLKETPEVATWNTVYDYLTKERL